MWKLVRSSALDCDADSAALRHLLDQSLIGDPLHPGFGRGPAAVGGRDGRRLDDRVHHVLDPFDVRVDVKRVDAQVGHLEDASVESRLTQLILAAGILEPILLVLYIRLLFL